MNFTEGPQSIDKYLSHALLLFYSLPIKDFLSPNYFYHLSLLVCSIHLLHYTKLSMKAISKTESTLFEFYTLVPKLYSLDMCTHVTHSLIHLTKCVRNLGPLWCYSTFGFESMNELSKSLVPSTRSSTCSMHTGCVLIGSLSVHDILVLQL